MDELSPGSGIGSYCVAKTPEKEQNTQDVTQETAHKDTKKPETNEEDLPSPPEEDEEGEEEDENRQNTDDRKIEMNEATKRTRDDAETQETGSEAGLALAPVGSIRSEDKYPPTPKQQEESGEENNIHESPLGAADKDGSEARGETDYGEMLSVISHKTELSMRTIPPERSSKRASDSEEEKGKREKLQKKRKGKQDQKREKKRAQKQKEGAKKEEKRKRQRGKNRT